MTITGSGRKVTLPATSATPLLRTDFSNDQAWQTLLDAVRLRSPDGFQANIDIFDDPKYSEVTAAQLHLDPCRHAIVFIADVLSIVAPEFRILCIDARDRNDSFRVTASEAWSVENNLSLGNMDFHEFKIAAGKDGVFRGFF